VFGNEAGCGEQQLQAVDVITIEVVSTIHGFKVFEKIVEFDIIKIVTFRLVFDKVCQTRTALFLVVLNGRITIGTSFFFCLTEGRPGGKQ
jgi:hypothetical protein